MDIKKLHDWNISYAQARAMQTELAGKLIFKHFKSKTTMLVAGIDCAFTNNGNSCIAVIVVLQMPDFTMIETADAICPVTFPYIPGLLTFREAPACIEAARKIQTKPDLIMIDGQGTAHPRRLGIASHLGLVFDTPTIGCAKSRLIGTYTEPAPEKGSFSELKDKDEVIGAVVRTRDNTNPIFVSPGHKLTLKDAIAQALRCTTRFRIPEPTRLAHQFVTKLKTDRLK